MRRRPNTASAPMANSATIGGSGTWVPELVLVELEVLVDELVEVEVEVEELVELEVLEVTLPEVEVLVETLPEVEVELPPVDVEVDEPPVLVEVELPLTLMTVPPLLLELPDDEPLVLVVELIDTCPPPLEPPMKPPKNPPAKPPPLDPPITAGTPPPPPPPAMKPPPAAGAGTGTIANCCSSTQAFSPSCSTRRLGASHS